MESAKRGDHVVLSYQSCGHCRDCRAGRPGHCRQFWELNFGFARLDGSNALTVINSLAVWRVESVAVFRTGSVGLAADPIIAVDSNKKRLALARKLGFVAPR